MNGELAGQSALVTGGAGFIGGHLTAELLNRGASVTVLDHLSTHSREDVPDDADLVDADVRDEEAMDRALSSVDVAFHLAAVVSAGRSVEEPRRSHGVNTDATLQLLELARRHDVRVVLASSSAIYGQPAYTPIDEAHPIQPASPYGIDKATVDLYARRYNDLYGLDTVALRYFNVYGPGQRAGDYGGVISIFADQARRGEPLTVDGDGSQTRDFVHVSDVVDANLLAATTDRVGEAFNVGTGTETSIAELAETVRAVTESDSEIVYTDAREGDVDRSVADISKAREQLGYEPEMTLEAGLESFLAGDD
ncbi:NAD-dependent epimerase/dehydratase family protein [Halorarius halobius]|uniref:NAD-dependent epimerase/dehydratase family protein n=1 Tax=Halorarius halobius TaxID=2962671 RepID=UPI0020CB6BA7|nr:NAD-dependent epimerase/dehydratase family protein [Halorarius halobius]